MESTDDNWQSVTPVKMPSNWQVNRVAETGSTNADLYTQAQVGAPSHSALMADNQTAGRGRLDRKWEAKAGANLLLSLLFRSSHVEIKNCQRVVAVSAVRACRKFVDESKIAGEQINLKWPNDLLLDSKKFGGMLSVVDAAQTFIVVGIGINLNWAPEYAAKLADFSAESSLTPSLLLSELLAQINTVEKFSVMDLHNEYLKSLATLGRLVQVELINGSVVIGRATEIDVDGQLIVETESMRLTINTGDVVHLRDANHE